MSTPHVPLRPCGVCSQPFPDGNCPTHPKRGGYRPERHSVRTGVYATSAYRTLRVRILIAAGHRCAYCTTATATSADHVIPHSKGGETSERNLVAACRACNTSKGNRTLREWVASGRAPLVALQLLAARIRSDLPV